MVLVAGTIAGGGIGALVALHLGSHSLNQWVNAQEGDVPLAVVPKENPSATDGMASRENSDVPEAAPAIAEKANAKTELLNDPVASVSADVTSSTLHDVPLPTMRPAVADAAPAAQPVARAPARKAKRMSEAQRRAAQQRREILRNERAVRRWMENSRAERRGPFDDGIFQRIR